MERYNQQNTKNAGLEPAKHIQLWTLETPKKLKPQDQLFGSIISCNHEVFFVTSAELQTASNIGVGPAKHDDLTLHVISYNWLAVSTHFKHCDGNNGTMKPPASVVYSISALRIIMRLIFY